MTLLMSPSGRRFLEGIEGLALVAYPDGDGFSIGYGHYGVPAGTVITAEQADALLDTDLLKYGAAVNALGVPLSQQQFDACVSLAYNIGVAGFTGSTVARLLKAGDYAGAADAFRLWNESHGQVDQRLVDRRERERSYFLTGRDPGPNGAPVPSVPVTAPRALTTHAPWLIALGAMAAAYIVLPRLSPTRRVLALG